MAEGVATFPKKTEQNRQYRQCHRDRQQHGARVPQGELALHDLDCLNGIDRSIIALHWIDSSTRFSVLFPPRLRDFLLLVTGSVGCDPY